MTATPARQLAFETLRAIDRQNTYTDLALDRVLGKTTASTADKRLATELVYGVVRRQRTLDSLIVQLGDRPQQPPDLRRILQIGLYQLRYLEQVPPAAAVNTSVELAKGQRLGRLTKVVNGILRQYLRQAEKGDPLVLPTDAIARLGVFYSFPDWIVSLWIERWGIDRTEALCQWFNQPPAIDLRVNPLKATIGTVEAAFDAAQIPFTRLVGLPQGLRLGQGVGAIAQLPGYKQGWWSVQDASAQLVAYLLDPQPDEIVVDACAAPGGKTTHIAELMQDRGTIYGCDRTTSRLRKLTVNSQRLGLNSIQIEQEDGTISRRWVDRCDRLLLDVPCSGLGTLHRHPDLRWRQSPEHVQDLIQLQQKLLVNTADWVKSGGYLVYATCTLNPAENQEQITHFLDRHPQWSIIPPDTNSQLNQRTGTEGWIEILSTEGEGDGFFMVKLKKN